MNISRVNWMRMLIGGVVATIILFVTDGLLHEQLLDADWKAVNDNLGIATVDHSILGTIAGAAIYREAVT